MTALALAPRWASRHFQRPENSPGRLSS
jgi:hypothetical protein